MPSITVVDTFGYDGAVLFGLDILAPAAMFPLVVGCSLRTRSGQIVDIPAKWLSSAGLALWQITATEQFKNGEHISAGWSGQIILALWEGDTFTKRLTDTGWLNWSAMSMFGSSTHQMDLRDEEIRAKYHGRMKDIWRPV